MADIELPIGGGFYKSRNLALSHQELVNGCIRVSEIPNSRSEISVTSGPGIKSFVTLPENGCRGLYEFANTAFSINGTGLYQINENQTSVKIATVPGSDFCSITSNGTQLVITRPGIASYVWDTATESFSQITTSNFLGPFDMNLYKDNFVIFVKNDIFQVSNAGDALTYTATDFSTAESDPDDTVTAITNNNQLFIFGRRTGEIHQTRGGSDFPFVRVGGGIMEKGCASRFLITNLDTTFVWVGHGRNEKPAVYRFINGLTPRKISTIAIDEIIDGYNDGELELSRAFNFMLDGYAYAVFSFPRDTLIYDITSSDLLGYPVWMQRKSGSSNSWRALGFAKVYGKVLVGDKNTGDIGYLDMQEHQEYGDEFTWSLSVGPFTELNNRISVKEVELDMKTGVANTNDADPVVNMRFSDNGTQFRQPKQRSLGLSGEYNQRVRFRRCGSFAKNRVVNVYSSSKCERTINRIIARIPDG